MTVNKVFDPSKIEAKWSQVWEQGGYYKPIQTASPAYCIMIPPPNVTGSLHMGHAFQDTIMDALIRYHRMSGYKTLWQVGTDHAGIATQMVVERQLQQQGTSRHDLGREQFIAKIWDWKQHSGNTITQQLRRLGASLDWSRERFTMDAGLSKAVIKAFVDLYRNGLIYRGQRLVNWDPVLHTAISDLEVESEEEQGHLWHIRYPLVDSTEYLIVATTRPETMLGDVAVAVHPADKRYTHLIGKLVHLPLTGRKIPIIADEYVDPEFGTGCVKITPAHDFNDYDVGMRHKLPLINIFTAEAKLNSNAPPQYQGMDRFDARKKILEDLTAQNLLAQTEPHVLKVPRGDRTNVIIEPFLTDQWFVKTQNLAGPAITAVQSGTIKFVPENWSKVYLAWMHNIQDWCISRQIWWGHRIPAWYDAVGNIYVGFDEADARKANNLSADIPLKQDADVLDTWFSSALWPFSTLGWPEKTQDLQDFYPTNVLVTGFDIIFCWVSRMIMFGLKFTGQIPFKEVYIHGLIQDQNGQKMSKTKGNVLDPLDLIDGINIDDLVAKRIKGLMQPQMAKKIEQDTRKQFPDGIPAFGTDALRFTYCALATTGRHIRFEFNRLETSRNFCTKLWNAARYVMMVTEAKHLINLEQIDEASVFLKPADRWILSLWNIAKQEYVRHLQQYRFDLMAHVIYEFVWNKYCDWYLEISKAYLTDPKSTDALKLATAEILRSILGEILQVLHPITPFITEELWQTLSDGKTLLINHAFPATREFKSAEFATNMHTIEEIIAVINGVRNFRGEMNISPNLPVHIAVPHNNELNKVLQSVGADILDKVAKIKIQEKFVGSTVGITVNGNVILIQAQDLIDRTAVLPMIEKKINNMSMELKKLSDKLTNAGFIAKAPEDVVSKEKLRLEEIINEMRKLQEIHKELQ